MKYFKDLKKNVIDIYKKGNNVTYQIMVKEEF